MKKKIAKIKNNSLVFSSFKLESNALIPVGMPSFDQWVKCGEFIRRAEGSVHFWIGDWLNYGEDRWGEMYSQVIEDTGFNYGTLANDKYVASRIDFSRRRENLTFSHHQEVASYEPKDQNDLLEKAEKMGLSVRKLRKEKYRILLENERVGKRTDKGIILGDTVKELKKLSDLSIDCVITELAYSDEALKISLQKIDEVLIELIKKVKMNSHLYFFVARKKCWNAVSLVERYFDIKNILVWDKQEITGGSSGDIDANYGEQYELVIFASKGRRMLNGDERPSNVIPCFGVNKPSAQNEKPKKLIKQLIENSTKKGEVVLNPFVSCGEICQIAKEMGRAYVGITEDRGIYNLANKRLTRQK